MKISTPEGARLRKARNHANLTQAELAKRVGVTQSAIGNIEAGSRGLSSGVVRIARVCGVSVDWLATGAGDMASSNTISQVHFSLGKDETAPLSPYVLTMLANIDQLLHQLAPTLQGTGRDVLKRWAAGEIPASEAAYTLDALEQVSEKMAENSVAQVQEANGINQRAKDF